MVNKYFLAPGETQIVEPSPKSPALSFLIASSRFVSPLTHQIIPVPATKADEVLFSPDEVLFSPDEVLFSPDEMLFSPKPSSGKDDTDTHEQN